jgi:hypothetical protein
MTERDREFSDILAIAGKMREIQNRTDQEITGFYVHPTLESMMRRNLPDGIDPEIITLAGFSVIPNVFTPFEGAIMAFIGEVEEMQKLGIQLEKANEANNLIMSQKYLSDIPDSLGDVLSMSDEEFASLINEIPMEGKDED